MALKEAQKDLDETDFLKMSNAQTSLPEFSCDYCRNGVSFPTFQLLCKHIRGEHKMTEYIQFRIKKTSQIPFRCQNCQFCFPDQKTYERHINRNQCQKFARQYDEYIESLEDDDADSDSEKMDTSDTSHTSLTDTGIVEISQPGERYGRGETLSGATSGHVATCSSWIICPIKTCSDSTQLCELVNHFNLKHADSAHAHACLAALAHMYPRIASQCSMCSGRYLSNAVHHCAAGKSPSRPAPVFPRLDGIFSRCPLAQCPVEFAFSPAVWSEIDRHLAQEHEIHWLFFKKTHLAHAASSTTLRLPDYQTVTLDYTTPHVHKCASCGLFLLQTETQTHPQKCQALKCTLREFSQAKCQILEKQLRHNFHFHTKQLV